MTTPLRAGWARVPLPTRSDESLLGYDYRQERMAPGNDGELDPLHARALCLAQGGSSALLVTLDHCVVSVGWAAHLRARAAAAAQMPVDSVVVACSHTHSAPLAEDPGLDHDLAAALPHVQTAGDPAGARVAARIETAVAEAAARAAGLTVPVTAAAASAPCGLAYIRRIPAADGVAMCWNPREQDHLRPLPARDPALSVVQLARTDGRSALLWSLGAHPVCLGKTSRVVSADWPGAAGRTIAGLMPGCEPLFVLGACGDAHPWIATQDRAEGLAPLGAAAGGLAAALAQAAQPDARPLAVAVERVRIGPAELDLAAWRIGGAVLVAAPVELFQSLAADLRARIPAPLVLATNANGWTGYWPARSDHAAGNYEVAAAEARGRRPGDGEALVDALAALALRVLEAPGG